MNNILLIGDIMLDKYVIGEVTRISPEAPVPIVNVKEIKYSLGGCGNVAANLVELGVNVDCLTALGDDSEGVIIEELSYDLTNFRCFSATTSQTTVKERIIADDRQVQMLRIDREVTHPIMAMDLIGRIGTHPSNYYKYDLIVVSDYDKGVITSGLMDFLRTLDIPIMIDPKPRKNAYRLYENTYMMTPNQKEWESLKQKEIPVMYVLVTKGKNGMSLCDFNQNWHIDANPVDVHNVTGAGDTVISVMAKCFLEGYNPVLSAKIAAKCAEYVVTKPGTSILPKSVFDHFVMRRKMLHEMDELDKI